MATTTAHTPQVINPYPNKKLRVVSVEGEAYNLDKLDIYTADTISSSMGSPKATKNNIGGKNGYFKWNLNLSFSFKAKAQIIATSTEGTVVSLRWCKLNVIPEDILEETI